MSFKKRKPESSEKEHLSKVQRSALFVNGAASSSKVKNLSMRFTEEELSLLRNEAKKHGRSMHAHLKWLFFQSILDPN